MRHLYDEQLKAMMMGKKKYGQNILASAASSGNKGFFGSVLAAAKDLLSLSEVRHPLYLTK